MLPERSDNILNDSHELSCGTALRFIRLLYSGIVRGCLDPDATNADFSTEIVRIYVHPRNFIDNSGEAASNQRSNHQHSKPICTRTSVPVKSTPPAGRIAAICSG